MNRLYKWTNRTLLFLKKMQFYFTDLLKNDLINSEDFLEICLLLISHWHLYQIVVGIEDTCVLRMLHTFNIF